MSDFHIVVIFDDYYTLIVAFLTKQIQNRYRYRPLPTLKVCLRVTGKYNSTTDYILLTSSKEYKLNCFLQTGICRNLTF